WPGLWTMGNLGWPGYGASTDGTWPYTYNLCDVSTFPNQSLKASSGPSAAIHSDTSRTKYNFRLSYLPGQHCSACTCPGESRIGHVY
ncbi:glycoside hydrolase family 16 protein, partial [Piloderma croceum F 1598]